MFTTVLPLQTYVASDDKLLSSLPLGMTLTLPTSKIKCWGFMTRERNDRSVWICFPTVCLEDVFMNPCCIYLPQGSQLISQSLITLPQQSFMSLYMFVCVCACLLFVCISVSGVDKLTPQKSGL